ncbi:YphA family membrane protein [Rubeoparvulum massiliense]|uniref:YphA family membrane protein n=1 Tax=Rubeoparvulum massiliense TaxID=1631346 RepID=UPI00065E9BD6|nr:hypothetical protein [Rubeoparvulum massiliense]
MVDGTITIIALWTTILLLSSGWLDYLCAQEQLAKRWIFVYLLLPLPFWSISIPFFNFDLLLGAFLLPFFLLLFFMIRQESSLRIHLIALSWLIALLTFLVRKVIQYDPILLFIDEKVLLMLVGGVPAVFLALHYRELLLSVLLGSYLAEILYKYSIRQLASSIPMGDAYFTDLVWMTLTFAFAIYILLYPLQGRIRSRKKAGQVSGGVRQG